MIEEAYVNFETAKLLKEKGFNEKLLTFYITDEAKKEGWFQLMAFTDDKIDNNHSDHCYLAPTLQMAMRWLREVHNKYCDVSYDIDYKWYFQIIDLKETIGSNYLEAKHYHDETDFNTYEEAVEAAIQYSLKNLI